MKRGAGRGGAWALVALVVCVGWGCGGEQALAPPSPAGVELGRAIFYLGLSDIDTASYHLKRAQEYDPGHPSLEGVGARVEAERQARATLDLVETAREVGDLERAAELLETISPQTRAYDRGRSLHHDLPQLLERFGGLEAQVGREAARAVMARVRRYTRRRAEALQARGPREALAILIQRGRFIAGSCDRERVPCLRSPDFYQAAPDPGIDATDLRQHLHGIDEGYLIDVLEVSVDDYAACIEAGACDGAHVTGHDEAAACNLGAPERGDHPINCVTLNGAERYCAWAGGRLPDEFEWERAVRGEDARPYAWGKSAPICAAPRAQGALEGVGCVASEGTARRGSHSLGVSKHGLLDAAGNVAEWTLSPFLGSQPLVGPVAAGGEGLEGKRAARGGDYASPAGGLRSASRQPMAPDARSPRVGFRCVYLED